MDVRWRDEIDGDWLGARYGITHADATMQEAIARVWLPWLDVPPSPAVAAPHGTSRKIGDWVFGYSAVIGNAKNKSGAAAKEAEQQKAAGNNARRVLRVIETLAKRYAGKGAPGGPDVLVVMPKALEDGFAGKLPGNVGTLHLQADGDRTGSRTWLPCLSCPGRCPRRPKPRTRQNSFSAGT